MLTNAKVMEARLTDEQVHYSSSGTAASRGRSQHGARHHGDCDRATGATDRRHSSSGWTCWHCGRKDIVESSAQQASQVWSALTALDRIILLLCADFRRISSRKPIKGDVSAPTRANRFTHWIMQSCQRRRTVVMIFITSPWMSQSTLCHQLLLSCSPRYPFLCLVILSRMSSFKWIELPPATPYHTTTSRGLARMWICNQHLQS